MLSYQILINYLQNHRRYNTNIKPNYCVITGINYHITIFKDQWDNYESISGKPYHLFHISSDENQNRCSSYFWVNNNDYKIKKIPKKYFSYNQPTYTFFSSTRFPCHLYNIDDLLKLFQKILYRCYESNFYKI